MFNSEAPYKRFFSEKEYPIIQAIHDCDKDKILDMMHKGWNVNTMGKHGMREFNKQVQIYLISS